jgi:hypothetical protein
MLRYQVALLGRSHRWLPPVLLYAAVVVAGSFGGMPLADGLGWSSAALVPAVGWLTRSALTAEPAAARACVATAGGLALAGVAAGVTCLLIGSAIGALGNPPLIQHRGYAVMSTAAVAIAAVAASGSPANAAIRATSAEPSHQLPWLPVLVAVALGALTWTVLVLAAPHRTG